MFTHIDEVAFESEVDQCAMVGAGWEALGWNPASIQRRNDVVGERGQYLRRTEENVFEFEVAVCPISRDAETPLPRNRR
jgi:hypothetical protein